MTDSRTRRQKLEAMARATESPNEAAIAQRLLAELDSAEPEVRAKAERATDDVLSRMRTSLVKLVAVTLGWPAYVAYDV